MSSNGDVPEADTVRGVAKLNETLSYYLSLRLMAKTQGIDAKIPSSVEQIIELAGALPHPDEKDWAALAVGKLPSKTKAKAKAEGDENGDKAKRGKWSEQSKAEMVRLVDDVEFRKETLGEEGTKQGHVNWTALAKRYGFSGNHPVHRQYTLITGKEAPGTMKRKEPSAAPAVAAAAEGSEPAAKKAKPAAAAAPAAAASNAAAVDSDNWKPAERQELIRLVEDEDHRKKVTGKRHLKWSRVAEALDKGKKECKKKYTALTGKSVDD